MKSIFKLGRLIAIFTVFLSIMLSPLPAHATGSMKFVSVVYRSPATVVVQLTWTGDASTGTMPVYTSDQLVDPASHAKLTDLFNEFWMFTASTTPNYPAPQNNYSIALADVATGVPIDAGSLASRSSTQTQGPVLLASSTANYWKVVGPFSITVTGNTVASGGGTLFLVGIK